MNRSALALLGLVAALFVGCATRPLTQLVVVVDSDYAVPSEMDGVEVEVTGPSGDRQRSAGMLAPGGLALPVTVTLVPASEATGPVTITATARHGARALVAQEVRTQFVRGESRVVRIVLLRECAPVRCGAGQTCREGGTCRDVLVPPETLPSFTGTVPPRVDGSVARADAPDGGPPVLDDAADDAVSAPDVDDAPDALDDTPAPPDTPTPPPDGCATRVEACNGVDDNCNGMTDEGFDLRTDANHCGRCGRRCGTGATCAAGICSDAYAATVTTGGDATCARRLNGEVACWGDNTEGVVGDGTLANRAMPTPVVGLTDATQLDMGAHHACVIRAARTVACWGSNVSGALGDGTTMMRLTPVAVMGISDAVELDVGRHHTCVRRASGAVSCWGQNGFGQLGDNSMTTRMTPVTVTGLTDAVELQTYGYHTCARRMTGAVVCWGRNDYGQLGDGTTVSRGVPAPVAGLTDAVELALGYHFSCARRATGAVVCWGQNDTGQMGDGTTSPTGRTMPGAPVAGLTDAVQISVGRYHGCARRATGAVVCWGANGSGQLGDGTATARPMPVTVMGLTDAAEVDVGDDHTCARRTSRALVCWGSNSAGQLGDGTNVSRRAPAAVVGLP